MLFPQCKFSLAREPSRMGFGRGLPALVLIAALLSAAAGAQEFKSDKPDPEARKHLTIANQCARSPGTFAQNRALVEDFFTKFYFPSMTGTSPEELAKLGALRHTLFKNYLWASTDEQFQRGLTDIAYAA